MADSKKLAEDLKSEGNVALQKGNVEEAIQLYSDAIKNDPENAALFSNRSAAYCKANKYMEALTDAETAVQLNPKWAKGFSRKGAALSFMNRNEEALMAYEEGLKYDPESDQIKQSIKTAKAQLTGPGDSQPLTNPFADPFLFAKLEKDPRTKEYLKDPAYKSIIHKLQTDPKALGQHMQDSRVMSTLGVLLGVQLEMADTNPLKSHMQEEKNVNSSNNASTSKEEKKDEPMDTSDGDDKKMAVVAKDKGNDAYKKKEFELAIEHYDKAIELDPTNIVFRTNKSAVFYEQKKYDECIKECETAVEIGRENRADYKLIAKAFARIGKTYKAMDELDNALKYYNKSLSEHRERSIAMEVIQIEKLRKENERLAYLDTDKSQDEKGKGNEYFKKGDYPMAVKHYTEAIKRNPDDSRIYSNRAACYTKLTAFPEALKDAESCVKLDPKFVKGYLRKGNVLLLMKENQKASYAFQQAIDIDSNCSEAVEGYRKAVMSDSSNPEEIRKRAMDNPEVQQILGDPAMQLILQQMQKDPKALQEHLKNPAVAKKIEKLLECGLISIR